jgi:hypothetical protein
MCYICRFIKCSLYNNRYIRKSLAVVLLVIFTLSNTPTRYLHTLFANHTDFVSKGIKESNAPQWSNSGINCHCESNVVIAPYTFSIAFSIKSAIPEPTGYTRAALQRICHSRTISFGLRGPPSLA